MLNCSISPESLLFAKIRIYKSKKEEVTRIYKGLIWLVNDHLPWRSVKIHTDKSSQIMSNRSQYVIL